MKLFEVNGKLKEMSSRNGFYFIDNLYIDGFCFNGSKLYLNFKGLVYLVISFIKFFRLLVNKVRCFQGFYVLLWQLGQLIMQLVLGLICVLVYKKLWQIWFVMIL